MAFNWEEFLRDHNVHYVTRGPNTPRNHVSTKCPFCGTADPSEHMAISLEGHGWHCWRNRVHKGRSPIKLIQALIGCSYEQAQIIAGVSVTIPTDFLGSVKAQFESHNSIEDETPLDLPPEFRKLNELPSCRPYIRYLAQRGLSDWEILTNYYGIRYCTDGPFHGRIIFPVYYQGKLRNWTARTISQNEELRYKQPMTKKEKSEKEGIPLVAKPVGHFLLWFDKLLDNPGDTICLTEGPFDALKVNYLGEKHGIQSTCFFTNSPSEPQLNLLHELLPHYRSRILLLDQGTIPIALRLQGMLTGLDVKLIQLPSSLKDPAEIATTRELLQLCT